MVLGSLSGSILGGFQSQKLGRKYSIMFDSLLFMTATIIFVLSYNLQMVLAARYLQAQCLDEESKNVENKDRAFPG